MMPPEPFRFLRGLVVALQGDITKQDVDAIVNAANSSLLGGGGVDGAIHRTGGPAILAGCRDLRRTLFPDGLPTGEAVMTTGGLLPAQYVIHTVGPVWGSHSGEEPRLLSSCYRRCIALAEEKGLASIAFPAISTGIYGYPGAKAARVVSVALRESLAPRGSLREVRLVFFSASDLDTFLAHNDLAPG